MFKRKKKKTGVQTPTLRKPTPPPPPPTSGSNAQKAGSQVPPQPTIPLMPSVKPPKPKEAPELTVEEVQELLKVENTDTISMETIIRALKTLRNGTVDFANNVEVPICSAWDYYRGEINGFDICLRLLSKLEPKENNKCTD